MKKTTILIIAICVLATISMAPYPNIGNTIRIFTDHGEETTTRNGPDDRFTDSANWEAFDAGNIGGLTTKGYFGAAFDGRYVYYVPCRTADFHGTALRYDTEGDFKSAASWESFDAGSTDGLATVGFAGAVFDGRYIYYIPFSDATSRHGRVLRFDTQGSFTEAASWDAYDAGMTGGSGTKGYNGAVFGNFGQRDGNAPFLEIFLFDDLTHGLENHFRRRLGRKGRHGQDQGTGAGFFKKVAPVKITRLAGITQHIGFSVQPHRHTQETQPRPSGGAGLKRLKPGFTV